MVETPVPASRFAVEVEGREVAVGAVLGLSYDPELKPPTTVVLRRAAGRDATFLDWARKPTPRDVRVTVLGPRGEAAVSYLLSSARPVSWRGPELTATATDLAHEELALAVETVDLR